MEIWVEIGLLFATNFITFIITITNFRVRLEQRLTAIETKQEDMGKTLDAIQKIIMK